MVNALTNQIQEIQRNVDRDNKWQNTNRNTTYTPSINQTPTNNDNTFYNQRKNDKETKNIRQISIIEDINHDIEQNDTLDQDNPETEENHQQYQINTMNSLNNDFQNNFLDFIDELENEINGTFNNDNDQSKLDHINTCPRIKVKINGIILNALIDSGSQVTAIDEDIFNEINKIKRLDILPINNTKINTAIKGKTISIKRQNDNELDVIHLIEQVKINLKNNFDRRKKQQKNNHPEELMEGDLVLLSVPHLSNQSDKLTHKFFRLYEGPYVIMKILGNNAFILAKNEDKKILKGQSIFVNSDINLRSISM
ncbi:hypothetical protein HCN44_009978 [Aphidius gifuensis]|uniref:Uncharacterized protein n=1 Tax=Aphidius gifuensis TaxID=684658 RepID=A0A834Y3J5_APHGI|nr:hypothetical protein HCN44_009978 [Aphidius gifuensis]